MTPSRVPNHRPESAWRDVLLTALAPMVWGSTYLVTTQWLPPDRPWTAACLRALPAGLLLVLATRHGPQRTQWRRLLMLSALNIGAFQALLFMAAYRLPGGLAAVLGALAPLFVLALGWAWDGLRPRPATLAAALLGVVGTALLLLSPQSRWDGWGVLAALGGMVSMSSGTYFTRKWQLDMPVLALTGWQLLLGGLMLVPAALALDAPLPVLQPTQLAAYGYLSLVGALLSYALWFRGVVRLPSVAVASLGLLSPLCAVLLGWVVLGQAFGPTGLLGMALVLGSVLAVQLSSRR
ncbi:EamA/DMT transporter family protein [Hydrogenophaga soli]